MRSKHEQIRGISLAFFIVSPHTWWVGERGRSWAANPQPELLLSRQWTAVPRCTLFTQYLASGNKRQLQLAILKIACAFGRAVTHHGIAPQPRRTEKADPPLPGRPRGVRVLASATRLLGQAGGGQLDNSREGQPGLPRRARRAALADICGDHTARNTAATLPGLGTEGGSVDACCTSGLLLQPLPLDNLPETTPTELLRPL